MCLENIFLEVILWGHQNSYVVGYELLIMQCRCICERLLFLQVLQIRVIFGLYCNLWGPDWCMSLYGCTKINARREAKRNLLDAAGTNMLTNSNGLWQRAIHFGATRSHLLHHSLFSAAALLCASRSRRCYASFPPPPSLSTKGHNKEPLKTFYFTAAAAVSPLAQPIIQFNVTLSSHWDAPAPARGQINDCSRVTPVSAH